MNNLMKSNKLTLILTAVVMTLAGQNALAGRADMRQANMEFMEIDDLAPVPILNTDFLEPALPSAGRDDLQFKTHFTIATPNVRVRLFIEEISNEVIANGGVETYSDGFPISEVEFITGSWEGDLENGWNSSDLPSPGQTLHLNPSPNGIGMFEGLVFGACESLTSYDMYHNATIFMYEGYTEIGAFEGEDTTTIDSTGYYPVSYTVRASDDDGVSDFHFSGLLHVECSANNDLQ